MASRPSYRLPRRTRIYGANYDIGESYYKKQLDDLDNKRGYSSVADKYHQTDYTAKEDKYTPKVSFSHDVGEDEPYTNKYSVGNRKPFLDDFDDEDFNSKIKLRTSKLNAMDGFNFGEAKKETLKKSYDTSARERSFLDDMDSQATTTTRRIKIKSESFVSDGRAEAEASSRVKATRARLADLETEMSSITDKQNEREKRNHSLKKLLSDSESKYQVEFE